MNPPPPSSSQNNMNQSSGINGFVLNPSFYVMLVLIALAFIFLFSSLGNKGMSTDTSADMGKKSLTSWMVGLYMALFFVMLFVYFFQKIYGWNISTHLSGLFTGNPHIDLKAEKKTYKPKFSILPSNNDTLKPQVFNIPGNYYSYEEAKSLCQAYDSRLATYDEIEDAYNHGSEWCNYGWSDGQMALFPTQKSTFQMLQSTEGHENDCGRPGINGGYMINPGIKYGVNCYGSKPRINQEEEKQMLNATPYPKNDKDVLHDQQTQYWKDHKDDILVSPFNYKKWGQ